MGPEGLEPSPRWLRARDAAANTWIPFGPEGVDPSSGPYKEPALAVELRAKVGPAGVEPTPYRLKGGYAAITPRPRMSRGRNGFSGRQRTIFRSPKVVRGGIAPATGDVSDRHASVTPPDQQLARSGIEPLSPV